MPAASPTLETVVDAVSAALIAISPTIGTVKKFDRTLDSEYEDLDTFKNATTGRLDLWRIEAESVPEEEGEATGEQYSFYEISITYTSVRVADEEWSKKARIEAERVRDALNQDATIFAIGGQRQLRTPETISIQSHGFEDVEDQKVYKTVLTLTVEARRFG